MLSGPTGAQRATPWLGALQPAPDNDPPELTGEPAPAALAGFGLRPLPRGGLFCPKQAG